MKLYNLCSSFLFSGILWKFVLGDKGSSSDLHDSPTSPSSTLSNKNNNQHEHFQQPSEIHTQTISNITHDDDHHEKQQSKVISFASSSFLRDIHQHASVNNKHTNNSDILAIYFIIFYDESSSDGCTADLLNKVEHAANLLDDHFKKFQENASFKSIMLPMVGKVDIKDAITNNDLQALFDIDEMPVLTMVLVEQEKTDAIGEENEEVVVEEGDTLSIKEEEDTEMSSSDSNIYSLDYVGKKATSEDIFETILHYWYRFVVAQETEMVAVEKLLPENSTLENEESVLNRLSSRPIFTVTSMQDLTSFLNLHDQYMFRQSPQDLFGLSPREEYFVRSLMKDAMDNEPYYALVQCRSHDNHANLSNQTLSSYEDFEKLALLYVHRKDVAFFTIVSDRSCDWMIDDPDDPYETIPHSDPRVQDGSNGIVRILVIPNSNSSNSTQLERDWIPHAYFHSSLFQKTYQPASTDDIMTFHLTDFALVHTTPSILWLDRQTTATLAFPTYREVHFVLFIDAHSPRRKKDGSFDYDSKSYHESKQAIDWFYQASREHQSRFPKQDVVFLIVPSTDVQVLKTFGVDIWSEMDQQCRQTMTDAQSECFVDDIPQLPSAMITSRRESSKYMKVYHLTLKKQLLSNHSLHTTNPLSEFLHTYFDNPNALKPTIKSESNVVSQDSNSKNDTEKTPTRSSSGIKIATAHTFESMVFFPNKHSILYLYTPTCGHCKRFHTIWKKFSLLIDKMNWSNQLDIITMDISKNDLFLELSVDHVPAVLFFRRGTTKDSRPEEMILEEDSVVEGEKRFDHNLGGLSDAKVIVEWVLKMIGSEELQEWKRQTLNR